MAGKKGMQGSGGNREGSGRKKKYEGEMCNIVLYIPKAEKENIRKIVREYLYKLSTSYTK